MAKVSVTGVGSVKPEVLLAKGRYGVKVDEAKIIAKDNGNTSLSVRLRVTSATPVQEDGTSPEDRVVYDFFPLDGYDKHKDGGTYAKQKLASFLNACGAGGQDDFDTDDLIGATFDVLLKQKADQDDIVQANVSKYLPSE